MLKLLALLLFIPSPSQSPGAPSQTVPPSEMGSLTIEPTWIYTTPLQWAHIPRGGNQGDADATVVVLYPEGQYLKVDAGLIKRGKDQFVTFDVHNGKRLRTGTWERTDDQIIRIRSRTVFHSLGFAAVHCNTGQQCDPSEVFIPGPITNDTCGLEGQSPTHLAQRIHCHQMILEPSRLNLDLPELQRMAADAFRAAPKP